MLDRFLVSCFLLPIFLHKGSQEGQRPVQVVLEKLKCGCILRNQPLCDRATQDKQQFAITLKPLDNSESPFGLMRMPLGRAHAGNNNLLTLKQSCGAHCFPLQAHMSSIFPFFFKFYCPPDGDSLWCPIITQLVFTPAERKVRSYSPENGLQPGLHALVDHSHWNRSGLWTHWEQQKSQ